jgi:hypothetical protein
MWVRRSLLREIRALNCLIGNELVRSPADAAGHGRIMGRPAVRIESVTTIGPD